MNFIDPVTRRDFYLGGSRGPTYAAFTEQVNRQPRRVSEWEPKLRETLLINMMAAGIPAYKMEETVNRWRDKGLDVGEQLQRRIDINQQGAKRREETLLPITAADVAESRRNPASQKIQAKLAKILGTLVNPKTGRPYLSQ